MKMKKFVPILLTLVMVFAFAACAGNTEPMESSNSSAPSQSSPEESNTSEGSQDQGTSEAPSETESEGQQPSEASDETADGTDSSPDQDSADSTDSSPDHKPEGSKILVAYFSATDNTEGVAQKLADGLGADLYEITPEQPYTDEDLDYGNPGSRSSVEMDDPSARPTISGSVEDMEQYDIVFIGYPIWWGEAPRIMSTFIESYDFSGKTLAAFCTSASSGFGSSDSALRSAAGGATWLTGHRFSAGASADDVLSWANGLGVG